MATVTKTIGTSSRDYSTITSWEADLDDFMTYGMGDDAVGEIYNDSVFDENFTINGGSSVGLNSITLTVPDGQRHDGTAGTGVIIRYTGSNFSVIEADTTVDLTIEWLSIDQGSSGSGNRCGVYLKSGVRFGAHMRNMIIHDSTGNSSHTYGFIQEQTPTTNNSNHDYSILNNIIYNLSGPTNKVSSAYHGADDTGPQQILNNTIYNIGTSSHTSSTYGIHGYSYYAKVKNNIVTDVLGSSSNDYFTHRTGSNVEGATNLSSDSTADAFGGTGHLENKTAANQFVSTTSGSEDLHLKATADAVDAGTDLGTSPTNVNIDIDGRDRDSEGDVWDMGADQYVASGGGDGGGYNKAIAHPITLPVSRPVGRNVFEQR